MKEKVLNFLKSKKFLDIFCYIFSAIYLFFALFYVVSDYTTAKSAELELKNLLDYTQSVNKRLEEEKLLNRTDNDNNDDGKLLFTDGKTAIISAYNNVYNADSFYIETKGTLTTELKGIATVKAGMELKIIRFNQNKHYDESLNYFISATSFASFAEKETNVAKKMLKENGAIQKYKTTKIEDRKPDFSKAEYETNNTDKILGENLFILNEETVKNITYFKVKKDKKGNPLEYYIQAETDPVLTSEKFVDYLGDSAESVEKPTCSKFIVTACLNKKGELIGMTVNTSLILVRDTPLGVKQCPCDLVLSLSVNNVNQTINYELIGF